MERLTIALTKGRILKETLPLLKEAGIEPAEEISESRKLAFDTNLPEVKLLVLRGADVLTYVRHGVADLGVSGKDMMLEQGSEGLYEMLDLGIARCRLMTAAPVDRQPVDGRLRVATKFINVARRYFAEQGVQVELIKQYGGMELAPMMGLSDCIVDIVDTGNTLKANGLEALDTIAEVSSRLVANKASLRMNHNGIQELVDKLAEAVARRDQSGAKTNG